MSIIVQLSINIHCNHKNKKAKITREGKTTAAGAKKILKFNVFL